MYSIKDKSAFWIQVNFVQLLEQNVNIIELIEKNNSIIGLC